MIRISLIVIFIFFIPSLFAAPLIQQENTKTIKLSPKVRVLRSPISSWSSDIVLSDIAQDKLISPEEIKQFPQVLGSSNERVYISVGDIVWANQLLQLGSQWRVYRPMQHFVRNDKKPSDAEIITASVVSLKEIAALTVVAADIQTSQLRVNSLHQEISPNDLLLPSVTEPIRSDLSKPSSQRLQATVLGHIEGLTYISNHDVVVLNRGFADGIKQGQQFDLVKPAAKVQRGSEGYAYQSEQGIQLGTVTVAQAMILQPYQYFSLALITRSRESFKSGVIAVASTR